MRCIIFRSLIFLASLASSLACSATPVDLVAGWNLNGNSNSASIDVAARLGDPSKITTVWKWNNATSKWAFYAPSMSPADLSAYALSKGYDVLTSVAPKEGFWVNAAVAYTVSLTDPSAPPPSPSDPVMLLLESDLPLGWSLVSSADNKTPSQINTSLSGSLNPAGKAITTTWTWDATTMRWRFYARALEQLGGTALADYIASKGYLPFSTALLPTDGFWMNIGVGSGLASTADLSVTKTCAINGAQSVLCTVTVTNNGSSASVSPLSLSDVVSGAPSDATYTGAGGTLPISCTPGAGAITPIACSANVSLAPAESKDALFSFTLPQGGSFTNCATALQGNSGTQPEANSADNTNICTTITVPPVASTAGADLVLTKTCALDPTHGPQAVYCAVTVHNNGTLASGSPITVTDTPVSPPTGTLFTSSNGSFMCSQAAGPVPASMACTYNGSIPVGQDGTTFFYFDVPQGGTFQNCASASQGTSVTDPNPANNTNVCASVVVPAPTGTTTGTLTIVKESQPKDAQNFAFYASGPNSGAIYPFLLDDDTGAVGADSTLSNSKTFSNLAPGNYIVSENFYNPVPVTGWTLASITCTSATGMTVGTVDLTWQAFTVDLAAGDNVTCTFINVKTPASGTATLTIVKDAQPNDAQDFAFYAFGPNSGAIYPFQLDDDAGAVGADSTLSNSKTFANLAPGSYSVKEDFFNPVAVTGWNSAGISCTSASGTTVGTVDMSTHAFTVDLAAGDNVTCKFVNTKVPPVSATADLSVTKTCAINGAQSVLCTVTVTNNGSSASVSPLSLSDVVSGAPSDATYTGAGGTLPISCTPGAGAITPIACSANVSLAPAESKDALFSFTLPQGGSFTNCATALQGNSGTQPEANSADNTNICTTITVPPVASTAGADLVLTKTCALDPTHGPQAVYCAVTVHNNGTLASGSPITVTDTPVSPPTGTLFTSSNGSFMCSQAAGPVPASMACTYNGSIPVGQDGTTFFYFDVPQGGTFQNCASASQGTSVTDPNPANSTNVCASVVVPAPTAFRAIDGPTLQVSKMAMIPTSLMTPVTFMSSTASGITTANVINGPAGAQFNSILTSTNPNPGETLVGAVATLPNSISLASGSPTLTMAATSCSGISGAPPCQAASLLPMNYADFGVWAINNVVGTQPTDSLITYSAYAGGSTATTSMTMPTSGTATYFGKMTGVLANTPVGGSENVSGDVTITVSFASGGGTITALTINNIANTPGSASTLTPCVYPTAAPACTYAVYAPYETPSLSSLFGDITLGTGSVSGSSFSAVVSTPSVPNESIQLLQGHFYGPSANEMAGTFTISKPGLGVPSQGMILIGSFGAK